MSAEQKQKTAAKPKSNKKENILEGDLTLQNSTAIRELFARSIAGRSKDITFSFKDVGDVDLSFVQILCAAHRTAHDKGIKISFSGCWPESFTNLISEAGLNEHVGCVSDCSIECPWLEK